jgi:hypothetical protein
MMVRRILPLRLSLQFWQAGRGLRYPTPPAEASVGKANVSGVGRCTAGPVARTLAVTAAYCLHSKRASPWVDASLVHFLLGYSRGDFAEDDGEGTGDSTSDWAIVRLELPAPADSRLRPCSRQRSP